MEEQDRFTGLLASCVFYLHLIIEELCFGQWVGIKVLIII